MTHLLPAARACCQHSSPGASREGGWALPAAVLMQMGRGVTQLQPWDAQPDVPPGWMGNGGRPGPSV